MKMWYCKDCDIETSTKHKSRHEKTGRHQKNIGINPYHNAKIYRIICVDTNKQYIGSTFRNLEERLQKHKKDKKQYIDGKSYAHNCASYQLLDNCYIELIEQYKCETGQELKTREQYYIESNECVNIQRAKGIGNQEYQKEYQLKNKEKIKARKKEYNEKNKEKIKAQTKEYNEKNKDKIKARYSRKVQCECGKTYTHGHTTRHKRSQYHINYIENVKQNETQK